MGFYLRIPLPGPFGFSTRLGGGKRSRPRGPSYHGYTRTGTRCHHNHRTAQAANECTRKAGGHRPLTRSEQRDRAQRQAAAQARAAEDAIYVNFYDASTATPDTRDYCGLVTSVIRNDDGTTTATLYAVPVARTRGEDRKPWHHTPTAAKWTLTADQTPGDLRASQVAGEHDTRANVDVALAQFRVDTNGKLLTFATGWPDWLTADFTEQDYANIGASDKFMDAFLARALAQRWAPATPDPRPAAKGSTTRRKVKVTLLSVVSFFVVIFVVAGIAGSHKTPPAPAAPTQAPVVQHHQHQAAVQPATQAPPAEVGCSPTTSSGNCYKAFEFCPHSDAGVTGTAVNGEPIKCVNDGGLRWVPQ